MYERRGVNLRATTTLHDKRTLPHSFFPLLKSYLKNICYEVKYNSDTSEIHEIKSGVPQGSILGPVLYVTFTADFLTHSITTTATYEYVDDTAILTIHENHEAAA